MLVKVDAIASELNALAREIAFCGEFRYRGNTKIFGEAGRSTRFSATIRQEYRRLHDAEPYVEPDGDHHQAEQERDAPQTRNVSPEMRLNTSTATFASSNPAGPRSCGQDVMQPRRWLVRAHSIASPPALSSPATRPQASTSPGQKGGNSPRCPTKGGGAFFAFVASIRHATREMCPRWWSSVW
jgi:hypothetical protein